MQRRYHPECLSSVSTVVLYPPLYRTPRCGVPSCSASLCTVYCAELYVQKRSFTHFFQTSHKTLGSVVPSAKKISRENAAEKENPDLRQPRPTLSRGLNFCLQVFARHRKAKNGQALRVRRISSL